jgi:polysaccharide deacetylase family protein (PEP-CTERM system associated)
VATPHLFSVDVEEHFQVSAFDGVLPRSAWDSQPSRVERNTGLLLDLMAKHGATGTFFTLGWVAERCPQLVRRIAGAGHEIGSHTWWHPRVSSLTPEAFREEVRSSKQILEDTAGVPVLGFRAPSFSIRPGMEWAFDVLLEEGYTFDSSLFPIRRPDYGWPGAPTRPHHIRRPGGTLLEIPMATTEALGIRLPAAGGGYLRHLPPWLMDRALREHQQNGIPAMLYIHPWEVDPDQPRLPVGWLTRVRHYRGLDRTLARLDRLMSAWPFTSVERWLAAGPVV